MAIAPLVETFCHWSSPNSSTSTIARKNEGTVNEGTNPRRCVLGRAFDMPAMHVDIMRVVPKMQLEFDGHAVYSI